MGLYLIGDVQGCDRALQGLLDEIDFSPSRDRLVLLGDLVNRGPDSLAVLRRVMRLGDSARSVLGNHDLHLLAVAHGVRRPHRKDTLTTILESPDREDLLAWIRSRPLALREHIDGRDLLMVHAGVLPSWTADQTMALAGEVAQLMAGPQFGEFLDQMYADTPARWADTLTGIPRLRAIVNVLTRLRFCTPDDQMEFATKEGADAAPAGFWPWFDAPGRQSGDVTVAFGHWSTLGWLDRSDVLSLDTGCVWGGQLSAARIDPLGSGRGFATHLIQVPCEQAQKPG